MSESINPDDVIDARGAACPGPLMDLVGQIKKKPESGTVLELQTTDSSSSHDVPEWVEMAGHEVIDIVEHGDEEYWSIFVRVS